MRKVSARVWIATGVLFAVVSFRPAAGDETPAAPPPPPPDTISGDVAIGVGTVDGLDESSKAQEYREIPNGFFLDQFNFAATKNAWQFSLFATDLLQEDERVLFSAQKPGTLRINAGYDQTPKWFSNTSATLFANAGGGTMLFPTPIRQQAESVIGASNVAPIIQSALADAQPFPDLRYRRDRAFGDLTWHVPVPGLSVTAAFSQELRNGTHPQTLSTNFGVGADITEFAGTTDFTSREASLGIDYARKRFDVGGSVVWSQFVNDMSSTSLGTTVHDAYIVDNPLRATDGTPAGPNTAPNNPASSRFLLSAPPDSRSAWINVHAGYRIADWGRASIELGVGQSKQDETFLPFTLNSAIVPVTPLVILKDGTTAVSAYDGTIDLTRWDARVSGHPLRWFSFEAFAHDYHYDNKTPAYLLPDWVSTDVELAGEAADAHPFGYEQRSYGANVNFRPFAGFSVGVGGRHESWDRTFRAVDSTGENIFDFSLAWAPASARGEIRLGYLHGERRFNTYREDVPNDPAGLRSFDVANRDRDRFELMGSLTPIDRLQLGLQLSSLEDTYPDSTFGVTTAKDDSWSLDFALDCGAGVTVTGDYGEDRFRWSMNSRYRSGGDDPADDWSTTPDDKTKNYSLGVLANVAKGKVSLGAHAAVTDATGKQPAYFAPGGQANGDGTPFPDVKSTLETYWADATWHLQKNLSLAFQVTYENWDETNFQRDVMTPWMGAVDPATSESVFLGARIPGYDYTWARVVLHYSF